MSIAQIKNLVNYEDGDNHILSSANYNLLLNGFNEILKLTNKTSGSTRLAEAIFSGRQDRLATDVGDATHLSLTTKCELTKFKSVGVVFKNTVDRTGEVDLTINGTSFPKLTFNFKANSFYRLEGKVIDGVFTYTVVNGVQNTTNGIKSQQIQTLESLDTTLTEYKSGLPLTKGVLDYKTQLLNELTSVQNSINLLSGEDRVNDTSKIQALDSFNASVEILIDNIVTSNASHDAQTILLLISKVVLDYQTYIADRNTLINKINFADTKTVSELHELYSLMETNLTTPKNQTTELKNSVLTNELETAKVEGKLSTITGLKNQMFVRDVETKAMITDTQEPINTTLTNVKNIIANHDAEISKKFIDNKALIIEMGEKFTLAYSEQVESVNNNNTIIDKFKINNGNNVTNLNDESLDSSDLIDSINTLTTSINTNLVSTDTIMQGLDLDELFLTSYQDNLKKFIVLKDKQELIDSTYEQWKVFLSTMTSVRERLSELNLDEVKLVKENMITILNQTDVVNIDIYITNLLDAITGIQIVKPTLEALLPVAEPTYNTTPHFTENIMNYLVGSGASLFTQHHQVHTNMFNGCYLQSHIANAKNLMATNSFLYRSPLRLSSLQSEIKDDKYFLLDTEVIPKKQLTSSEILALTLDYSSHQAFEGTFSFTMGSGSGDDEFAFIGSTTYGSFKREKLKHNKTGKEFYICGDLNFKGKRTAGSFSISITGIIIDNKLWMTHPTEFFAKQQSKQVSKTNFFRFEYVLSEGKPYLNEDGDYKIGLNVRVVELGRYFKYMEMLPKLEQVTIFQMKDGNFFQARGTNMYDVLTNTEYSKMQYRSNSGLDIFTTIDKTYLYKDGKMNHVANVSTPYVIVIILEGIEKYAYYHDYAFHFPDGSSKTCEVVLVKSGSIYAKVDNVYGIYIIVLENNVFKLKKFNVQSISTILPYPTVNHAEEMNISNFVKLGDTQ